MAQKERITKARSRMLSGVSGGGSFLLDTADTAFAGASSPFSTLRSPSVAPAPDIAGAGEVVDMAELLVVTFGSGHVQSGRRDALRSPKLCCDRAGCGGISGASLAALTATNNKAEGE